MVVLKVLREFAGGTSIHGFGFLVSHKTSARSKIIWAISLVVAMIYASAEMRNSVISKYQYLFQNHRIETLKKDTSQHVYLFKKQQIIICSTYVNYKPAYNLHCPDERSR